MRVFFIALALIAITDAASPFHNVSICSDCAYLLSPVVADGKGEPILVGNVNSTVEFSSLTKGKIDLPWNFSCLYQENKKNGAGIDLTTMGLATCAQACSEWCWATVSTEVITYSFKKSCQCNADECTLATYLVNQMGYSANCCSLGCSGPCNTGIGNAQRLGAMLLQQGMHGTLVNGGVGEDVLQGELDNLRPVILAYNGQTWSHVVLLVGYEQSAGGPAVYSVADPWGNARYTTTFAGMADYKGNPWVNTLFHLTNSGECFRV